MFDQPRRHGVQFYPDISYFLLADFLEDIGYGTGVVRRAVTREECHGEQQ